MDHEDAHCFMACHEPSAVRSCVRKLRRFAASLAECGLPAPVELGYSFLERQ